MANHVILEVKWDNGSVSTHFSNFLIPLKSYKTSNHPRTNLFK